MSIRVKVIIPASGSGSRFGGKVPKQFFKLNGTEILSLTISKFHVLKSVDEIIISVSKNFIGRTKRIVEKHGFYKVKNIIEGGKLRQHSVYNALKNLNCRKKDIVIVHDSVRPFVSVKKIREIIEMTKKFRGVILGLPVSDTLKLAGKNNFIERTLRRENVWTAQTPQAFEYEMLINAFTKAIKNGFTGTDEASVVEYSGFKVKILKGEPGNVKITFKEDLKLNHM